MQPIFRLVCWSVLMTGSACSAERVEPSLTPDEALERDEATYTLSSCISAVMADPAFGQYGRLLFPVQSTTSTMRRTSNQLIRRKFK